MKLFDSTLSTLERSLDVRLMRHSVLAGNVANADTPGFKQQDLDFGEAMRALEYAEGSAAPQRGEGTAVGGLEGLADQALRSAIKPVPGDVPGIDGNGVDIDHAMVAMAENSLKYSAAARAAGKKLAILRYVASDGIG